MRFVRRVGKPQLWQTAGSLLPPFKPNRTRSGTGFEAVNVVWQLGHFPSASGMTRRQQFGHAEMATMTNRCGVDATKVAPGSLERISWTIISHGSWGRRWD